MNTIQAWYTKYVKRWVKALASAIGGAVAGLIINWVQGTSPIPRTRDELVTVVIAALLPAILTVFSPANKITQKQLDADKNVIGGVVVPDAVAAALPPSGAGGGGGGAAVNRTYQTNTGETRTLPDYADNPFPGAPDWKQ